MYNFLFRAPIRRFLVTQKGVKPSVLRNKSFKHSVPYLDINALETGNITEYTYSELGVQASTTDVLIVWDGSRSGLVFRGQVGVLGSTIMRLTPIGLDSSYLYYFLKSKFDIINLNTTGIGIPHVNPQLFFELEIPYAEESVQKLIVRDIDLKIRHNAEVIRQQRNMIQRTLSSTRIQYHQNEDMTQTFQNFKYAVLKNALEGKLTESWRKKKKIRKRFKKSTLGEIANVTKLAGFEYSKYIEPKEVGEVPLIRAQNVKQGYFLNKNLLYIDEEISDKLVRSQVHGGELLMVYVGASVGDVCIAPNTKAHLAPNVAKITLHESITSSDYLNLYFQSEQGKNSIKEFIKTTAQPNLSMTDIRKISVTFPSLDEQKEIVKKIHQLLQVVNNIESNYKAAVVDLANYEKSVIQEIFDTDIEYGSISDNSIMLTEIDKQKHQLEFDRKIKNKELSQLRSIMNSKINSQREIEEIINDSSEIQLEDLWKQSKYFANKEVEYFYCELSVLQKAKKIVVEFENEDKLYTKISKNNNVNRVRKD